MIVEGGVLDRGPFTACACVSRNFLTVLVALPLRGGPVSGSKGSLIGTKRHAAQWCRHGMGFLWGGLGPQKLVSVTQTPRYGGQSYQKLITAYHPIETKIPKAGVQCVGVASPTPVGYPTAHVKTKGLIIGMGFQ